MTIARLPADDLRLPRGDVEALSEELRRAGGLVRLCASGNFPALRSSLVPAFDRLTGRIRQGLAREPGYAVVEALPFVDEELETAKALLLILCSSFGDPRPTFRHSPQVVWEVTPTETGKRDYTPTVTEHRAQAGLHTDSSFKRCPERYVALYCVRPASDGGLSKVLDGRRAIARLEATESGRRTLDRLSRLRFRFRVPTRFTRSRRDSVPEWLEAPVLAREPRVRWRYDLVAEGLAADLEGSQERRDAVETFRRTLDELSAEMFRLRTGDLLVLDNHHALHGRTAFTDPRRLLLRIRSEPRA